MSNKIDYKNEKAIFYAFQITKKVIFEVSYNRLGCNRTAYFSTQADRFNQPKTDFDWGGQAQEELLPHDSAAYRFYQKWDKFHLEELTDEQVKELEKDIVKLRHCYNSLRFIDTYGRENIPFRMLKDLSMFKILKNTVDMVAGNVMRYTNRVTVPRHSKVTF